MNNQNNAETEESGRGFGVTMMELLACMEQSINNLSKRVSEDIVEIKESIKTILLRLVELEKQNMLADSRMERDYVKKANMPCEGHQEELAAQSDRFMKFKDEQALLMKQISEDLIVIKTKWSSEFSPIRNAAWALLMVVLTAIITATLSLVLIKAQLPTFNPSHNNVAGPAQTQTHTQLPGKQP